MIAARSDILMFAATGSAKLTGIVWFTFVVVCLLGLIAALAALVAASTRWHERGDSRTRSSASRAYASAPLWWGVLPALLATATLGYLVVGVWGGAWEDYNDALPRLGVASNPSTAPGTLDRLVGDPIEDVRRLVASNPSTAPETLDRLADDSSRAARLLVASNPSTAADTLDRLADGAWHGSDTSACRPEVADPTRINCS